MSTIRPFRGIRPAEGLAAEIAALPYDVYSSSEARKIVQSNPMSFLKIDRAETLLPEGTDIYSPEVYRKARQTLDDMIRDGAFVQDEGNATIYMPLPWTAGHRPDWFPAHLWTTIWTM